MNKDNKLLEMIIEMLLRKGFSRNTAERNAKIMIEDMATQNWRLPHEEGSGTKLKQDFPAPVWPYTMPVLLFIYAPMEIEAGYRIGLPYMRGPALGNANIGMALGIEGARPGQFNFKK